MAKRIYDVVATLGSYVDSQGNERRRYVKCGAVLENDKGLFLKLDVMPIGAEGFFSLFEPDRDGGQENSQRRPQRQPQNRTKRANIIDDDQEPF